MKFKLAAFALSFLLISTHAFAQDQIGPGGFEFRLPSLSSAEAIENEMLFKEIYELIRDKHVEEKTDKELTEGAINGMIKLLDKHSSYLPPVGFQEMRGGMSGEFSGIGSEVRFDEDKKMVNIERVLPRSPSAKAGLKTGDKIWKIDDSLTQDFEGDRPINKAVKMLRGTTGTDVKVYVERDGVKLEEPIIITRGVIKIESVKTRVLDGDIAYMTLSQFGDKAVTEVAKAIQKFADDPEITYQGLIFDLRDNPGGLLDAAIIISDMFLDEGVIVSVRPREGIEENFYRARIGQLVPKNFPIVILINENSASASEIVAGTLQDHKRVVIVGKKSYGKGSVQTVIPLINGGALRLTTAKYHTASGQTPHDIGIKPDVEVDLPEDYYKDMPYAERQTTIDPQMVEAIKVIRQLISGTRPQTMPLLGQPDSIHIPGPTDCLENPC